MYIYLYSLTWNITFHETIGFVYLGRLYAHGKDDLRIYYITLILWYILNNLCDILFMLKSCLMLAHMLCAPDYVFFVVLYVTNIYDTMFCFVWVKKIFLQRYNIKAAGIRIAQIQRVSNTNLNAMLFCALFWFDIKVIP